jgi:hypothetical protein
MLKEIESKLETLRNLNYVLSELEEALEKEKARLLREKYEKLDIVHGLYLYLKSMEYPLDLYDCCCGDSGEWDKFKHVEIKVVYGYGYTDVVGLTKRQFKKLNKLIKESWN